MDTSIMTRAEKGKAVIPTRYCMTYGDMFAISSMDWFTRTVTAYYAGFYVGILYERNRRKKKARRKAAT